MTKRRRLILAYSGFGPYHLARWRHIRASGCRQGWEVIGVEVLAAQDRYHWSSGGEGEDIIRLGLKSDGRDQVRRRDAVTIIRRIGRIRPDVVAVNGWALRDSLLLHAWCRLRRVPCVVVSDTTARDFPRRAWREVAKRTILWRIGAAFVAGAASSRYVQSLGVPVDHITDGCDVVDNAHFAPARAMRRPNQAGTLRLLTVARLVPEKNLVAAAEAVLRLAREDGVDLVWSVAGYGPDESRLRALEAASEGRIRLLGEVAYTDLPAVLAAADVLWLPSLSEPWGLVVNEAMAAGLPVAVSDRAGCHEDLVMPATGWTFDPTSEEGLLAGLRRVVADRWRWPAMGAAAAELVAAWDLHRFSRGLLDAADLALAGRPRRRAGR